MEASSSINHFRSISLPSRLTHPSFTNIQTKINSLKGLGNFVGSSESIQSGLAGLAELYVCVYELVRSPQTQQLVLSHHLNETLVEAALEVSILLLDSCTNLKDLILLIKENVQILQLALKRKGGDSKVTTQIAAYLCCRKKAKKIVSKSLTTLKNLEKKMGSFLSLDIDHHVSMVMKVLGEVNAITISLFRSILVFLSSEPKRCKGVEFVSKLVYKNTYEKHQRFLTEVGTIDVALTTLHKNMRNGEINDGDVQTTIRRLQILDASLEGFDAGLDYLFRRLTQNRSSLLNIVVC